MDQSLLILIAQDFPEKHRKSLMDALKKAKISFLVIDETTTATPSDLVGQAVSVVAIATEGLFKSEVLTGIAKEANNAQKLASVGVDKKVEMPDWFEKGGSFSMIYTSPSREEIRACLDWMYSQSAHLIIPEQRNEHLN